MSSLTPPPVSESHSSAHIVANTFLAKPGDVVPFLNAKRKLRDYQQEALEKTLEYFSFSPSHDRAQIIMGCGTGKTITGQRIVEKLTADTPDATVLLLFPSLALLQQTYESWVNDQILPFEAFALCSGTRAKITQTNDTLDLEPGDLTLPYSTDPADVATWMHAKAGTRRFLFATYQSSDRLVGLHSSQAIPSWNVALFDEAHRTAGAAGSKFSTALHQDLVAIDRRLFMTATRRTFKRRAGKVETTDMADRTLYGDVVYTLSHAEAVSRGIVNTFKVVLVKVTNAQIRSYIDTNEVLAKAYNESTGKEQEIRAREAAAAIAVIRAAKEYDLRATLSFHHTIANAQEFSHTVSEIAGAMPSTEKPERPMRAVHVSGQDRAHRDRVLGRLEDLGNEWHVVSNARVLTEGVNAVNLDSIAFVDPKRSAIDAVQAVGRIVRINGSGCRPGIVILPVIVENESGDVAPAIDESKFDVIHDTLLALRTMDPDFMSEFRAAAHRSVAEKTDEPIETRQHIASDRLSVLGDGITADFVHSVQIQAYREMRKSNTEEEGYIEHMLNHGFDLKQAEVSVGKLMADIEAEQNHLIAA